MADASDPALAGPPASGLAPADGASTSAPSAAGGALTDASSSTPAVWTVLDVIKWTTGRFTARGLSSPRLDAELLAAHAFGMARVQLYTHFDRPLAAEELAALRELVRRRQAGEPVAYLTGKKEFWSLDLRVDSRVLVPRPDTETLVEVALDLLPKAEPRRVADIGTGSGAVALALKRERPEADVVAVDRSPDALAVARANALRLGLAVRFVEGDLLAPLAGEAPFDLLTANLPYIPTADLTDLAPEVRSEPRLALDGGADGLDLIRRLLAEGAGARASLVPGGAVALEIGVGQAGAVAGLLRAAGLVDPVIRCDLAGLDRVVVARAPGGAV
jgi:release factor glutamine methyltransferase